MSTLVTYSLNAGVATLTLDDGKANVMSPAMLAELNAALDQVEKDNAALLLTGRKGMFSGGFDLKMLAVGGVAAYDMLMTGFRTAERLLAFPAPVVVACNGHALAMGVFLVASADYVIAAEGPYKIGANEVAIGLSMPKTVTEICRSRLVPAHFNRALIQSEIYTPADAIAAGFVDRVVPEADLARESQAVAARLAKLNRHAYAATKHRVRDPALKAVRAGLETDEKQLRLFMPAQR